MQGVSAQIQAIQTQGLNVRLFGDVGAGKTTLVRAFLRAFNFKGAVKSPTFTLVESYELQSAQIEVHHFDCYRFESAEEFEEAGFIEYFDAQTVTFVEWANLAEPYVPAADLEIFLAHEGLGRKARLQARSSLGSEILKSVAMSWI